MRYTAENILVKSQKGDDGLITRVTPHMAGWEFVHFEARRLHTGQHWAWQTDGNELALVVLGGRLRVTSNHGEWEIGEREHVFQGLPWALYLPRRSEFAVVPVTEAAEIACGWCVATADHPARVVRPEDANIELRGGGNATRQINDIIPPGFPCSRLVVVEVYTPSGNWSSYPPHKHDVHREDEQGNVIEADLEEVYYYKLDRPEGYAYQRVYTDDGSIDALVIARDNDVVLVPEGYHPVVSAHGYTTYYLNVLAGSAQSLANSDDPTYAWVKETWSEKDPRVPIYPVSR